MFSFAETLRSEPQSVIRWRRPSEVERRLLKAMRRRAKCSSNFWDIDERYALEGHNKAKLNNWLLQEWNSHWTAMGPCRQTRLFFPTISPRRTKQLLALDRNELGLAIQFLTGHCFMNRHQSLIDGYTNPNCRLCASDGLERDIEPKFYEESPEHIMWYCSAVRDLRVRDHIRHPGLGEWTLDDILWVLNTPELIDLLQP